LCVRDETEGVAVSEDNLENADVRLERVAAPKFETAAAASLFTIDTKADGK
jgi:hypothetical protein